METMSIAIPIGLSILTLFMFYSSGSIIANIFNLKQTNGFINIAIGFFCFFAFANIAILPFQFISILPLQFHVFFMYGVITVYLIMCILLFKYWITFDLLNFKNLIFLIVVILLVVTFILHNKYLGEKNPYGEIYSQIALIDGLSNKIFPWWIEDKLNAATKFSQNQSFYLLQIMTIQLFKMDMSNSLMIGNFFMTLSLIQNAFIVAAIFMTFIQGVGNFKKLSNNLFTIIISFCFLLGILSLLANFGLKYYEPNSLLLYLVIYVVVLLINYASSKSKILRLPFLIGILLFSYSAFSWESSYPILFLLYAVLFSIQRGMSNGFTKDILKISILPSINIVFYSFMSQTYIQSFLFVGGLGVILIMYIALFKNQKLITRFEVFIKEQHILMLMILPIILGIISAGLSLGSGDLIISQDDSYLNFLYIWSSFIWDDSIRVIITFIMALVLVGFAFAWVIIRTRFNNSALIISLDLTAIMYLTFYNPLVIKFVNIIYPDVINDSGMIMATLILINIIYSIDSLFKKSLYKFDNKISSKKISTWFRI